MTTKVQIPATALAKTAELNELASEAFKRLETMEEAQQKVAAALSTHTAQIADELVSCGLVTPNQRNLAHTELQDPVKLASRMLQLVGLYKNATSQTKEASRQAVGNLGTGTGNDEPVQERLSGLEAAEQRRLDKEANQTRRARAILGIGD